MLNIVFILLFVYILVKAVVNITPLIYSTIVGIIAAWLHIAISVIHVTFDLLAIAKMLMKRVIRGKKWI